MDDLAVYILYKWVGERTTRSTTVQHNALSTVVDYVYRHKPNMNQMLTK